MLVQVPMQPRGINFPGAGLTEGYKPPWGHWEPNPGPLLKQPVLLTAKAFLLPLLYLLIYLLIYLSTYF